ncbi:MAG TPA: M15 family metallopeptidase, partial [Thermoleophilaceae bacterium]|nr:M15 family metallopeptidase [Thermoleophilaceae bacterium]
FALAVLTDGNLSHGYGAATLRGVAARLFARPAGGPLAIRATQAPAQPSLEPAGGPEHRRAGLVDVRRSAPSLVLDVRYASRRNLTGRRLPGYCKPWALLTRRAAGDLAAVQRELRRRGLGLLVWDAYRPARASLALVRWAQRTGRAGLVGTYIARRSRHNTGSAVDLTLARLRDGRPLAMGTGYDHLGSRAHTRNTSGAPLRNRLILARVMGRHGFRGYAREWWHFEHARRGRRYLDLPLGCAR